MATRPAGRRRRAAELTSAHLVDVLEDLAKPETRPRILTLSTYPVDPMVGGGQRRARFLSRALARTCDVTVLVNSSPTDRTRRRLLEVGLTQIEVPKSEPQLQAELDMFHAMNMIPVDDITAAALSAATPAFGAELGRRMEACDAIIATHPFLLPCVPPAKIPIVHDSHNVESILKAELLPETAGGRWLLEQAAAAEVETVRRAAVVGMHRTRPRPARRVRVTGDTAGFGCQQRCRHRCAFPQDRRRAGGADAIRAAGPGRASTSDPRPYRPFIGPWYWPNHCGCANPDSPSLKNAPIWTSMLLQRHERVGGEGIRRTFTLIVIFAESEVSPSLPRPCSPSIPRC